MKYISCKFFLIFICFLFCSCKSPQSEIQYINLYITTVKALSCKELEQSSNKKKHILSKVEVSKLLVLFSQLKPADSEWNVDARVSGFVFDGSKRVDFCMSSTIIEIKGIKYFVNENLRKFVLKITVK